MHSFQTESVVSAWAVHLKKVAGSRSPKGQAASKLRGFQALQSLLSLRFSWSKVLVVTFKCDILMPHACTAPFPLRLVCQPDQRLNLNVDLPVGVGNSPD